MANKYYLVRLDDACPYMDSDKWGKIESILDLYGINPMVGIIPNNEDQMTMIQGKDEDFWTKALQWQKKGWEIALHGYNHCYTTENGGLNPIHNRSEFAGLTYDEQKIKIKDGYNILINHNLYPKYFFAPSHTYDEKTIEALKNSTPIRNMCDTITI